MHKKTYHNIQLHNVIEIEKHFNQDHFLHDLSSTTEGALLKS